MMINNQRWQEICDFYLVLIKFKWFFKAITSNVNKVYIMVIMMKLGQNKKNAWCPPYIE